MVAQLSRTMVENALNYVDHVEIILDESNDLLTSARSTRAFADGIIRALEDVREDRLEVGLDRIIALNLLKEGLATHADTTRKELSTLLSFMLKWLMAREPEPRGAEEGDTPDNRRALVAALERDLANTIDLALERHRRARAGPGKAPEANGAILAWNEQVFGCADSDPTDPGREA